MGRRFAVSWFRLIFFAFLLAACTLPTSPRTASFYVDVYDPANGAIVQLGSPVYVDSDAVSGRGAVTRLDNYANGVWIGGNSGPDLVASGIFIDSEVDWNPPAVGEYLLQASAIRSAGLVVSAPVRVCVVDFPIDAGNFYNTPYGYEGVCPIPPRDAAATPGTVTLATNVTPDHLVYRQPGPDGIIPGSIPGCTPQATLSFQSTVVDPPEDVAVVAISLSLPTGAATVRSYGSLSEITSTFLLSQTAAYAGSTRIFEGSTEPMPPMGFIFGDLGGTVTWTAQAIGRDGSIIVADGPHTIPASPCAPAVPLLAPFTPVPSTATIPPLIEAVTPTSTLAASGCPPGTYLAPNSNECIQVFFTPTPKPVRTRACKRYTDPSSCTTNGCSWDKATSTCSG